MTSAAYESALARLPEAYALVLRLSEAGVGEREICARLDIEYEALEPLLELARRKLNTELSHRRGSVSLAGPPVPTRDPIR